MTTNTFTSQQTKRTFNILSEDHMQTSKLIRLLRNTARSISGNKKFLDSEAKSTS